MAFNVILLRGLSREKRHWGDFKNHLLERPDISQVIGIDLPGNGQFNCLKSPLSVGDMAEFVHSHNPWQSAKQGTVLVSVSLGSMVATEIVSRHPRFYALSFMINTSFSDLSHPLARLRPKALESFAKILRMNGADKREAEILRLVSNHKSDDKETLKKWIQWAKEKPTSNGNALRQLLAAARYRLPKEKPKVPLYLLASKADRMVHWHCSKKFSEHWDLPLALHGSAGHELALDDPQWVCSQIADILEGPELSEDSSEETFRSPA